MNDDHLAAARETDAILDENDRLIEQRRWRRESAVDDETRAAIHQTRRLLDNLDALTARWRQPRLRLVGSDPSRAEQDQETADVVPLHRR